jgi:hypothetical protein
MAQGSLTPQKEALSSEMLRLSKFYNLDDVASFSVFRIGRFRRKLVALFASFVEQENHPVGIWFSKFVRKAIHEI